MVLELILFICAINWVCFVFPWFGLCLNVINFFSLGTAFRSIRIQDFAPWVCQRYFQMILVLTTEYSIMTFCCFISSLMLFPSILLSIRDSSSCRYLKVAMNKIKKLHKNQHTLPSVTFYYTWTKWMQEDLLEVNIFA